MRVPERRPLLGPPTIKRKADRKNKRCFLFHREGNLALLSHVVDVSEGVQPACRMLGAGFVKLRQRGSLCRRKLRRGDTLLPRRAHVSEGKGVSPCIRIRPEGGDVQVRGDEALMHKVGRDRFVTTRGNSRSLHPRTGVSMRAHRSGSAGMWTASGVGFFLKAAM